MAAMTAKEKQAITNLGNEVVSDETMRRRHELMQDLFERIGFDNPPPESEFMKTPDPDEDPKKR